MNNRLFRILTIVIVFTMLFSLIDASSLFTSSTINATKQDIREYSTNDVVTISKFSQLTNYEELLNGWNEVSHDYLEVNEDLRDIFFSNDSKVNEELEVERSRLENERIQLQLEQNKAKLNVDDLVDEFKLDPKWVEKQIEKGHMIGDLYDLLLTEKSNSYLKPTSKLKFEGISSTSLDKIEEKPPRVPYKFTNNDSVGVISLDNNFEKTNELSINNPNIENYVNELISSSSGLQLNSTGGVPNINYADIDKYEAPYTVSLDKENISLLSGQLSISETDMELPGRNELAFSLERIYESSNSQKYDMTISPIWDPVTNTVVAYWTDTTSDKLAERFPLGKGWSWNIPYIEAIDDKVYVTFDGATYEWNSSNSTLKDYPWSDLTFNIDQSVSYNNLTSKYVLSVLNGKKFYFNDKGYLILIKDVYSNEIGFTYYTDSSNKTHLNGIVDSIGNRISIAYNANSVVVSLFEFNNSNPIKVVTYNKTSVNGVELLTSVVDAQGRITSYGYEEKNSSFALYPRLSKNNPYFLLKESIHPTGVKTKYTYEDTPTTNYLATISAHVVNGVIYELNPPFSQFYQVYRVKSREDIVRYCSTTCTDESNNYSSFVYDGSMSSPSDGNYTFSVFMFSGGLEHKYEFDKVYRNASQGSDYYNDLKVVTDGILFKFEHIGHDRTKRRTEPISTRTYYIKNTSPGYENINNGFRSNEINTSKTYDDYRNITSSTNEEGLTSTYSYDGTTRLLNHSYEAVTSTQIVYTNIISRNAKGDITEIVKRKTNASGEIIQHLKYEYDIFGNILKLTDIDIDMERVTSFEYNSAYQNAFPTKVTQTYISLMAPSFSLNGAELKNYVIQGSYERATGRLLSITDANNNITRYKYDKLGRLVSVTNPDNSIYTINYRDVDNRIETTDEVGIKTYLQYSPLGLEIESGYLKVNNNTTVNVPLIKKTYDKKSRIIRIEEKNKLAESYSYTPWDRISTMILSGNRTTSYEYNDVASASTSTVVTTDAEGNKYRSTYDLLGREVRQEELYEADYRTTWRGVYDKAGRLITEYQNYNSVEVPTSYTYDHLGNLVSVTNALSEVYSYGYNRAGQLVTTIYPDQSLVTNYYDQLGRVIIKTDENNNKEYYIYNPNGKVATFKDKKGQYFSYSYDIRDRLKTISSSAETISYSYDSAGKRLSMKEEHNLNNNVKITNYQYDNLKAGVLNKITYPDGKNINYNFTDFLRLEKVVYPFGDVLDYTYATEDNMLNSVKWNNDLVVDYEYDGNTLLETVSQANGVATNYSFEIGRMSINNIRNSDTGYMVSEHHNYIYDVNGNITDRIVLKNNVSTTDTFGYDKLNRISTSTEYNETFTYDNRGNRETETSTRNETMNPGISYVYDEWNRLIRVINSDNSVIEYSYNGDGLLTERKENGVTTRYYYDRNSIIAEGIVQSDGSSIEKVSYIRGNRLEMLETASGIKGYYTYNGHGDVIGIYGIEGSSLNSYTYDIWGNPTSAIETVPNIFRYSGELWDEKTGLQYLRARWYDPNIGRFINEDTYKGEITNPLTLNLYTYTANNPLIYVDPDGHFFMLVTGAIGLVAGGIAGGVYSYAKYGELRWKNIASGAAIGGAIGLTGGAAAAYLTTGSVFASTGAVFTSTSSSWLAASSTIPAAANSAVKGREFEKWYYSFNNIAKNMQQVVVKGFGRVDAIKNGRIIDLKNYDWSKYKSISSIINSFVDQATKYQNLIGRTIEGEKIKEVAFYFSSKPPAEVINALKAIGVVVDWVK